MSAMAEIKKVTNNEPTPPKPAPDRARYDLEQEVASLKIEIGDHAREAKMLELQGQTALRADVLDEHAFKSERVRILEAGLVVTAKKVPAPATAGR